jgi:alkylhydroperoxidase family enzyme
LHHTRGRREINGCDYWLAAHAYLGKNVAKLSEGEIETNRRGKSVDAKAASAVHFAARVVAERRQVDTSDVEAVRAGGFSEAEIVEILAHVALNTLANYLNEVAETAVDFPAAPVLKAA